MMFRTMRRSRQVLPEKEAVEILERASSGVLALLGDEGYPYAVPLSYVYHDGKLYFHGAKNGHKMDSIRRCPKASFCVIEQDAVKPEEYTTYFKSVIVFGIIRILEQPEEMRTAALLLAKKYDSRGSDAGQKKEIDREWDRLCMMEFSIEHMSGKEAVELTRMRKYSGRD